MLKNGLSNAIFNFTNINISSGLLTTLQEVRFSAHLKGALLTTSLKSATQYFSNIVATIIISAELSSSVKNLQKLMNSEYIDN